MPCDSYYRNLRNSLKEKLFEQSDNSIQNIILSLNWNDSIYRTFNEGLRLAQSQKRRGRIPLTLVEYLHSAHISYIIIALRKLYEKENKDKSKRVNSIRTITSKIDKNKHLFIRENYITHDDTPYEDQTSLHWKTRDTIQYRHKQFDLLCGRGHAFKRKPDDRILPIVIDNLNKFAILDPVIEEFANKFLAHASAKENRPDEKQAFDKLKLNRIQNQYKNVIWATQQLSKIVDEPLSTEIPTASFDVLTNWENGLFDITIKEKLLVYWQQRVSWWQDWTNHYQKNDILFLSPKKQLPSVSLIQASK